VPATEDKPGGLQGQHTCSPHASLVVQGVSCRIRENLKGVAVPWYNIHFVALKAQKEAQLFRKIRNTGRKDFPSGMFCTMLDRK